jgi:hypothetical protein
MKAYVRSLAVLSSPPGFVERLLGRLEERGVKLPPNSLMNLARQVRYYDVTSISPYSCDFCMHLHLRLSGK